MTLSFGRVLESLKTTNWLKWSLIKQLVSPLEEVPSAPEPKWSKTSWLPQPEACRVDAKPTKLSLSLKKPYHHSYQEPRSNRPLRNGTNSSTLLQPGLQYFSKPVSSPERKKTGKGVVPDNIDASTQWALRNFNEWAGNHYSLAPEYAVPKDLLASHDADLVCKWLCQFLMETRKIDSLLYPLSSLRSLIRGINHILQSNQAPFSVVDKCDSQFHPLLKLWIPLVVSCITVKLVL